MKNSWNMLPLFRWGKCRWLAPSYKPVRGLVRTRHSHVTTHLIHYWLSRNSKKQRTGESFQVQGLTFSIHLSPSLAWALKSQGRVGLGFSWHQTHGFSTNHPNHSQGAEHCQLTSDTISVELVPMPQVELSTLSWLQMPAMWSCLIMLLTKRLKFVLPMTPTPCSKTQSNQRPNSGILLLVILTLRYRIKSETVKWRRSLGHGRSGGEWGFHAMLSSAPSPQDHLLSLHRLSEPLFMDFYWAFTQ